MSDFLAVIHWRGMAWTLPYRACHPLDIRPLLADFGNAHPIELKVIPA